jgi:hypothetical protein
MKVYCVQFKYDSKRIKKIEAEIAELDSSHVSFIDSEGNPVNRFDLEKVKSWWLEEIKT